MGTLIAYVVNIVSPASREVIAALFEAVERSCPILNLLRQPQAVRAELRHVAPGVAALDAYVAA